MASDYRAIRTDNERRYGTDIGRIGPMLLAERYDERTHFIFELLQNAEDALARRRNWSGPRSVRFHLTKQALCVSHFGHSFDEADVRGICGIAESTKDLTAIGRFGIGFKSVYAFTDRPEVHSGAEEFAIESFVWPVAVPSLNRNPDETVVLIPLRISDQTGHEEIAAGLRQLGATALLFLRQIDEIHWDVETGKSGHYLRESKEIEAGIRHATVIGQEQGESDVDQTRLIFSRAIIDDASRQIGCVELAFLVSQDEKSGREAIQRVEHSPLVVFFPTVRETHLGFLVQGPYRTTPSRDNVPPGDPWNQRLVNETASLLVVALRWLRDHDFLNTTALQCLPLDRAKFGEKSMFAPLFVATKHALISEPLLPRFDSGYASAGRVRLARTQELRDLFAPTQLAALFGQGQELTWLSGDITTQERTADLRRYLMQELDVAEVTPKSIISRLNEPFLRPQQDSWLLDLYHFFNGQPSLRPRLSNLPLIRLQDGRHVPALVNNRPQAFLPGKIATAFPTVRAAVCATDTAREFLRSLGLTEPNPVDDVIHNVLPRYRGSMLNISDSEYEATVGRILAAFDTDSKVQREKLINALRDTAFVMATDVGAQSKVFAKPNDVYLATDRLKQLFGGVKGVLLVDDTYPCLRGEDIRELLEACGAVRYLRPVADSSLPWEKRRELRAQIGHVDTSGQNDRVTDWMLSGLDPLITTLQGLEKEPRTFRSQLLWEELAHLEERRGKAVFTGEYTWTHYGSYRNTFDAAFIRRLNSIAWVPGTNGNFEKPEFVVFETLGWKPNPFLQSKIRFKPPIIETLAKEVGIEPGVIDLLKKLGLMSEADLRDKLAKAGVVEPEQKSPTNSVDDAIKNLGIADPKPPIADPTRPEPTPSGNGGTGSGGQGASANGDARGEGQTKGPGEGSSKRTPGSSGGRPFISYVAAHPEDDEPDPDGLDQQARMALEAKAIEFILSREPKWQRTLTHNPGYDLYQANDSGHAREWCEVKAMTGTLHNRPVGLSRTQFICGKRESSA